MRRPIKKKTVIHPDTLFGSVKVAKLINHTMFSGKKATARTMVYATFDDIKARGADPLEVYEAALRNVGPTLEVRSRRIGGATYQVPREVRPERKQALALRWIIDAARSRKGSPMAKRLADELFAASKNEGDAVKKRENTMKMAEANRAFAHFAW